MYAMFILMCNVAFLFWRHILGYLASSCLGRNCLGCILDSVSMVSVSSVYLKHKVVFDESCGKQCLAKFVRAATEVFTRQQG